MARRVLSTIVQTAPAISRTPKVSQLGSVYGKLNLRSSLKIFGIVGSMSSFVPIWAALEEKMPHRDYICAVARSTNFPDEAFNAAKKFLSQRFHSECQIVSVNLDSAFGNQAKSVWKQAAEKSILGFWFDLSPQGKSTEIVGIDLPATLEYGTPLAWDRFRTTSSEFSPTEILKMETECLEKFLENYPAIGVLEKGVVTLWSKSPPALFELQRRSKTPRDHFQPLVDFISTRSFQPLIPSVFGRLREEEGSLWLQWQPGVPPSERLWVFEKRD